MAPELGRRPAFALIEIGKLKATPPIVVDIATDFFVLQWERFDGDSCGAGAQSLDQPAHREQAIVTASEKVFPDGQ